jgi:hypothetical protein
MRTCSSRSSAGPSGARFGTFIRVAASVLLLGLLTARAGARPDLDAETRREVVQEIVRLLAEEHLFPERGEACGAHLEARLGDGAFDRITDPAEFAFTLTRELRSVDDDAHLRVELGPPDPYRVEEDVDPEEARRRQRERFGRSNFGFQRIEWMDESIGYLDLRQFAPVEVGGETAVAAMNMLAGADAVIIDLRKNGGGSGEMIQLIAGYFFREPTHLCSYETRGEPLIRQSWSLAHVPGRTMYDTPLYVLTSRRTGSAAEEFTYDFKHLGRATIIGETTGGGGHTCISRRVADRFDVVIPHGRPIHPVTGTGWERVGVVPDIDVPAEEALARARYEALNSLIETAADEDAAARYRWGMEAVRAEIDPVELPPETLAGYTGDYGPVGVVVEDGALMAGDGRHRFRLVPLGEDRFHVPEMDQQAQFVRNDDGRVIAVEVHFRDGRSRRIPRN